MVKVSAWTPKFTFPILLPPTPSQASFLVMFSNLHNFAIMVLFPLHVPPTHSSASSINVRSFLIPIRRGDSSCWPTTCLACIPDPARPLTAKLGVPPGHHGNPSLLMTLKCRLGCKEETGGEGKRQAQKKERPWDFVGGPVAKILCSQYRRPRLHPWSGNYIPHGTTNSPCAPTKDFACSNKDGTLLPQLRPGTAK